MKQLSTLLFYLFLSSVLHSADYFWVGGTGDWSDPSHWATTSGGVTLHPSAPGPNDNVFFDANSFTAGGQVVTVDLDPSSCLHMDWTGVTNLPKLLIATLGRLDVYGDLVLVPGMELEFAFASGSRIRMQSTTTGRMITTAGHDMVNLRFEGAGGEWSLQDDLVSSSEIFVSNGSLISNGRIIKANRFTVNSPSAALDLSNSQVSADRFWVTSATSINLANSEITATDVRGNVAGTTFNELTLTGAIPKLNGNSLIFETLRLSGTTRTEIGVNLTVNNSLIASRPGSEIQINSGITLTINGLMDSQGGTCSDRITWRSNDSGNAFSIAKSSGSIVLDHVILRDIHGIGGATFTANNSIGLGNTTGWTINSPAPQTYFWIADNGGDWSDGNNWSLSTGGPVASCVPGPSDNVVFDANSFNTAAIQPVILVDNNLQQAHDMTWTGVVNNPILDIPVLTNLEIYGDLMLAAGMTIDFSAQASSLLWMKATDAVTIHSAGQDLVNFRIDGPAGTFTLDDPLTSSYELFIRDGELNLNGFDVDARTVNISGAGTGLNMSNSTVTASHQFRINSIDVLTASNSLLTTNSFIVIPFGQNFDEVIINGSSGLLNGNSITMENLTIQSTGLSSISGSHTITGTLLLNNPGGEVEVGAGTTINLADFQTKAGGCGNQIYLRSNIQGSVFTFDFTGVTPPIGNEFLILQDTRVLNGPFEVNNSIDLGNTPGWIINEPAPRDLYWIGGSGDWDDPAHWSSTSGGLSAGCLPTVRDDVFFDHNSFTAGGQEVRIPGGSFYCRNMEWKNSGPEAVGFQPSFRLASLANLYVFGSLLMADASQMSYSVDADLASKIWMSATSPGNTIRSGGLDLINFRIKGEGGGWTLADDLSVRAEFFLTNGALNTNSMTMTGDNFIINSSSPSLTLGASRLDFDRIVTSSSNINAGTSLIISNDLNANPAGLTLYNIEITDTDAQLNCTDLTVNHLKLAGPALNTLSGNILVQGDLELDSPGSTVILGTGRTLEVTGDIIGNALAGNRITLRSGTPGVQALLRKTSGQVCLEHFNIQDSNAGGGAVFGAVNSTDNGNNSGWNFSAAPSCAIFLPVECADFQAILLEGQGVQLDWTTWSEKDNAGFQVQRSIGDGPFATIAWVAGAGNNTEPQSYSFLDPDARTGGTRYYRLLQIDRDGQVNEACDLLSVEIDPPANHHLSLYPNPASQSLKLTWQQPASGTVKITVIDALGRPWRSQTTRRKAGRQSWSYEVGELPVGNYSIRLKLPDEDPRFIRLAVSR